MNKFASQVSKKRFKKEEKALLQEYIEAANDPVREIELREWDAISLEDLISDQSF